MVSFSDNGLTVDTPVSRAVLEKAIEQKPWIRRTGKNIYRVCARVEREGREVHGKYELEVAWDRNGNPTVLSCFEYRKQEECPGFRFNNGGCYHASSLLLKLVSRKQRKNAA